MEIGKYSWGIGDRFIHQAEAQLKALILAKDAGIDIVPVWNKSNREHSFIHSEPASTRAAADAAVKVKGETNFIPEVSMDEVNDAQSPIEMFFILSAPPRSA